MEAPTALIKSLEAYSPKIAKIVQEICEALSAVKALKTEHPFFAIQTEDDILKTTTLHRISAKTSTLEIRTIEETIYPIGKSIHGSNQVLTLDPSRAFLNKPQYEGSTMNELEVREVPFQKNQEKDLHKEANIEYLLEKLRAILEEIQKAISPENIQRQTRENLMVGLEASSA